jgi:hypothetical protein
VDVGQVGMIERIQNSLIKDVPVNTAGHEERQGRNKDPISIAVCMKMFLQIFDLTLKGVRIITDKVKMITLVFFPECC